MENKKEKLEDFKTAISSTVRSISNSEKIEVSFGNQTPKSEKNSIKLPELSQINNKLNFDQIRAIADSKSLNFRFSNNKTFKQYEPEGSISKKLYRISEKMIDKKNSNLKLSKARADAVKKEITTQLFSLLKSSGKKIVFNNIHSIGYGENLPEGMSYQGDNDPRRRVCIVNSLIAPSKVIE